MFTKWEPNYRLVKCSSSNFQLEKQGFWFLVSRPFLAWKGPFFRRQSMCLSARLSDLRRRTFFPLGKAGAHSGFPCINFVFEIMIPKKVSKPKKLIKLTIYRRSQVPAQYFSHFGPFSTFLLIFLDFSLMISWNSISQKPMKPVFACKV